MKNRFQKMLVTAVAMALMLGAQPAAADPGEGSAIQSAKAQVRANLNEVRALNTLGRGKGASSLLRRDRAGANLQQDKGAGGLLSLQKRSSAEGSVFLSRARTSALRSQTFFAGRPLQSLLHSNKSTLHGHPQGGRLGTSRYPVIYSRFRSSKPARRSHAVAPARPAAPIAYVKAAINNYFYENTIGALFIQKDPKSGQTYRLQFASAPVTREVNPQKVAIRCSFYGQTALNSPSVPVVIEYTVTGSGQSWNVSRVQFASINGRQLAGDFDIQESDLVQNVQALDEKAFPTKSL